MHRLLRLLRVMLRKLSRARGRTSIHFSDPVGAALDDAEILVAFAAQSYRKIEPLKISHLLARVDDIRSFRRSGQIVPSVMVSDFWIAYDAIAADIAPLSAHSIRSTARLDCRRFPGSLFTPTGYNVLIAFAVFIVCLMLQGFWVAGRELLSQAEQIEQERVKIGAQLLLQEDTLERLRSQSRSLVAQCGNGRLCPGTVASADKVAGQNADDIARSKFLGEQILAAERELVNQSVAMRSLNAGLEKLSERSRPLEDLMRRWYDRARVFCNRYVLEYICPVDMASAAAPDLQNLRSRIWALRNDIDSTELKVPEPSMAPAPGQAPVYNDDSSWVQNMNLRRKEDRLQEMQKDLAKAEAEHFRSRVVEVKMMVQNLGTYFIAMLMGILGALAYIIRSISSQLREHTYVPLSFSSSIIRICLGAIAGVFGGMQAADGSSNFNEVPSVFIPFVFGYGIEILFSLLDRIVHSLAQPEQTKGGS